MAVWSRSESAAADLLPVVKDFAPNAKALSGEDGLAAVLEDRDVDAVAIVLPAHVQLEVGSAWASVHMWHQDRAMDRSMWRIIALTPAAGTLQLAERALAAGKAVLQEKPIAQTAADAFAAVERHRAHAGTAVWAIAENYRCFVTPGQAAICLDASAAAKAMSAYADTRLRHEAVCSAGPRRCSEKQRRCFPDSVAS